MHIYIHACIHTYVRTYVSMYVLPPFYRQMHTPLTTKVTSLLTKNYPISQTKLFSVGSWQNCFKWRNISQNIDKFKFTRS